MFIENGGQFAEGARFQVWGGERTMWLVEDGIWTTVLDCPDPRPLSQGQEGGAGETEACRGVNLKLSFPGSNPHPRLEPFQRLETVVSYLIGSDPQKWRPAVPVWGGVRYVDLYPGIDLLVGQEGRAQDAPLQWRLVARDGADLSEVRLRVEGADGLALEGDRVRVSTAVGELSLPLLLAVAADGSALPGWKEGPRVSANEIVAPFASPAAIPTASVGLAAAVNQPSSGSVADTPAELLYATFLGGSGDDESNAIAVDGTGCAYVTGLTKSTDFPSTAGAFDRSFNGGQYDAFVVKVNANGSGLVYATFMGGSGRDWGKAIAVDDPGCAYVTGGTDSSDFPSTVGAFDRSYNGGDYDAFVMKVNANGTGLEYATFLGGIWGDEGRAIAVDGIGCAYVTGLTRSSDFPSTAGALDRSYHGVAGDAFVVEVNANGTDLLYATFLGGSGHDLSNSIAVDSVGCAYVTGWTYSSDFPSTAGAFDRSLNSSGDGDAFVVKVNANGTGLAYATFLGGSGYDEGRAIAVDGAGCAYVTGDTDSSDFPSTAGAFDRSYNGGQYDAFVVKVNADGTRLPYATFLGGSGGDEGRAIAVDDLGCAYVTGDTDSSDFPSTAGAFDRSYNGGRYEGDDAFVVKVNANGMGLAYASFLGGSAYDFGMSIAVDGVGCAYLTGWAYSSNFPSTAGAFDRSHNGGDAYVVRLAVGAGPALTPTATHTPTRSPTPTATPTRTPTPVVTIPHIEVTQVIQDEDNNVTLIAGKPTFARVYLDVDGCTSVTGVLRGYRLMDEIPRSSPISPVNASVTVCPEDGESQRGDLQKSMNFTLPLDWCTEGTIRLVAEVAGVRSQPVVVQFHRVQNLRIALVPILYEPPLALCPGAGEPSRRIDLAHLWALKIYPTAGIEPVWLPAMPFGKGLCLGGGNNRSLANELVQWRNLWNSEHPNEQCGYVFGWLPSGAITGGVAYSPAEPDGTLRRGIVAFGEDELTLGKYIFAREVAHLFGRPNAKASDPGPGDCGNRTPKGWSDWSYPTARIQDWGLDGVSFGWLLSSSDALKDPSVTYDYMSYCMYENVPIWSSPFTYEQIYEKAFQPVAPAESARPLSAAQTYLLAGAVVYKDGTANLEPCWVIRSEAGLIQEPTGTQYCLEAQNAAGTALISHCLDLPFVDTNTGESADADGFSLMLPYPEGVSRIVLKKGAQELAVRHVSAHVPVVTVLSPNGGESWAATGTYTIAWTASDLDAEPLTYRALYSPDGSDWTPIGGTTSETHLTVDTAELAGGDRARVRVLASDGINTGADESDASFVVGQKGPQVYIVSPEGDGSLPSGGPFFLQGYAYDREDRALDEAALRWSSSRDGDLGTGSQVLTSISRGQHTITLTATDSHGNVATASVNIYVGSRVWLPVVLKG